MRRSTCDPKYGAGLGLRIVAWISCKSSEGAYDERSPATGSWTDMCHHPSKATELCNLIKQVLNRLTDFLKTPRFCHRQIRAGDVPGFGCNLVLDEPVFHCRAVNPRPALNVAKQQIQRV